MVVKNAPFARTEKRSENTLSRGGEVLDPPPVRRRWSRAVSRLDLSRCTAAYGRLNVFRARSACFLTKHSVAWSLIRPIACMKA